VEEAALGERGILSGGAAPHNLGLLEHPEASAPSPQLKASYSLQYEAVMDRVQKSKLSLYKKAMEVRGELGLHPLCVSPGLGIWDRLASNLHPAIHWPGWISPGLPGGQRDSPTRGPQGKDL
jgi:hypothetical protein